MLALMIGCAEERQQVTSNVPNPASEQPASDPAPQIQEPAAEVVSFERESPFSVRKFDPTLDEKWIGTGVSYGPFRDGQSPLTGSLPSKDEIAEDLEIILPHWQTIRIYSSSGFAETILEVIREKKLPMKVLLGAWIGRESFVDEDGTVVGVDTNAKQANQNEVDEAIRLANKYPDLLVGINVGNETQVDWSDHRIQPEYLIQYIRQVREETDVPVTTADDFVWWQTDASKEIAKEVDFIVTHVYAMWHSRQLEESLDYTKEGFAKVQQAHPDQVIALGEAGWATQSHTEGLQGERILGQPGEAEQKEFYDGFRAWSLEEKIPTFYFEAFDENWKGGEHPDEVEKHWGVFNADRTPKAALRIDSDQ